MNVVLKWTSSNKNFYTAYSMDTQDCGQQVTQANTFCMMAPDI